MRGRAAAGAFSHASGPRRRARLFPREVVGDDERWLFGEELLKLDAWSLNEKGQWSPPELKAAYLDDTKPMD